MMNARLAVALLCTALALALARAPRDSRAPSLAALAVGALIGTWLGDGADSEPLSLAVAASTLAAATAVLLPLAPGTWPAAALALNAGAWGGAFIAAAGVPSDLLLTLPLVLLCVPIARIAAGRGNILFMVAAGWLVAIALIAIALPLLTTPGYHPDHME